jgi:hypothetical protein
LDRPNPRSLATSPAFSSNGSMAGPPSSRYFPTRSVVPCRGEKQGGRLRAGPGSVPASEAGASQVDHPRHRTQDTRVLAGVAAPPSSPSHL